MTTGEGQVPGNAAAAPVPPEVVQAAQAHNFGRMESTRSLANPRQTSVLWLVIGIVCFVVLWLLSEVGSKNSSLSVLWSILHFFGLLFCFAGVFAIVAAIRVLVTGARSYYVYENGFVYRHNGNVRAIAWPEVTSLQSVLGTRGSNSGKLTHYNLNVQGIKPIPIPIQIVNGRDDFLDHLIAALGRFNRPVV
ncbi:DUF6585 family protein [Rugosimonospora africana]|uniref:Uncharacterized protein n=1 Tax=Rugosimonospora africana TaxID=556532 RepID=A0A8J3VRB8_9ACTN|nr:DUF6585 family protein [Rugosimonospora africana]GIH15386.1 hypothetical protein Raf01_35580 [Rugosimonospora africana]